MIRVAQAFSSADAGVPRIGSLVEGGFPPGVFIRGESTSPVAVVDGGVSCANVSLTVDEYAAMALAGTCTSALSGRGFVEPPCLACSSTSPLVSALALLVVVALRRRASRA